MSHYDHLKDLINDYEDKDEVDAAQPRKMKKKSVIILTPPILPMTSPKINDALNLD